MEELQSTEVLDREILEDARKKALRTLKSCEDTIIEQDANWNKKLYDAICEIDAQYDKQKKYEINSIMARLPVDKLREKMNKLINLLNEAVDNWYKDLSREEILNLLSREFAKRTSLCKDKINNTDKTIIDKDSIYPSIVLENNNIKITVSMKDIIDSILQDKRYELIEALTGSEFLGEMQ